MPNDEGNRAGREGDTQPMPTKNDHPSIQDAVIADMEARKAVGMERYNTLLQPFNGRNALQDAYEEALDLATYLKQCIVEEQFHKQSLLEAIRARDEVSK